MNIKTYYVLTSENEEYWTYDNYFKKYTRFLLTPLNRQKLLKFSSLEKAQKEASKIMEESICLSDDINKVFIEPMVIDEEKMIVHKIQSYAPKECSWRYALLKYINKL